MPSSANSASKPAAFRAITTVDLKGLREPFVTTCERYAISPSEALRRCVAAALAAEQSGAPSVFGPEFLPSKTQPSARRRSRGAGEALAGVRDAKRVRVEVRLSESEHAAVAALASQEGFSVQSWLIVLIRSRLVSGAQLGETELGELAKSNYELRSIGRNLNQVAKALNVGAGGQQAEPRLSLLEDLKERIDGHVGAASRVLEANLQRWKVRLR